MEKKRVREEAEEAGLDIDSPEVKRLKENLLALDDESEICTWSQDLDSFMKSFEVEITALTSAAGEGDEVGVVGPASDTVEPRPDLGYLLEASDDELGIPPPSASPDGVNNESRTELVGVETDSSDFGSEFWENPCYDSFGFGFGETDTYNCEYVSLDGLFDCSDMGVGSDL